jgi:hypothetical protein
VSTYRWYTVAVAVLFVSALATPTDARRYTVRCLEGARCDLDNEHNGICTFSGDWQVPLRKDGRKRGRRREAVGNAMLVYECLPWKGKRCNEFGACPADSYCERAVGRCRSAGTCETRPDVCPADCPRVCGCNGKVYCNSCLAARAGVSVRARGPCQ